MADAVRAVSRRPRRAPKHAKPGIARAWRLAVLEASSRGGRGGRARPGAWPRARPCGGLALGLLVVGPRPMMRMFAPTRPPVPRRWRSSRETRSRGRSPRPPPGRRRRGHRRAAGRRGPGRGASGRVGQAELALDRRDRRRREPDPGAEDGIAGLEALARVGADRRPLQRLVVLVALGLEGLEEDLGPPARSIAATSRGPVDRRRGRRRGAAAGVGAGPRRPGGLPAAARGVGLGGGGSRARRSAGASAAARLGGRSAAASAARSSRRRRLGGRSAAAAPRRRGVASTGGRLLGGAGRPLRARRGLGGASGGLLRGGLGGLGGRSRPRPRARRRCRLGLAAELVQPREEDVAVALGRVEAAAAGALGR